MDTVNLTSNQEHIVDVLIKKNPNLDRRVLEKAVAFIADAHDGQYRKSGMPYTEHPYEVAKILAELQQDQSTVLAGLLHDVVEDTQHTLAEIAQEFGEDTAFMVDAVTKITAAQEQNKTAQKAETYRKLITAMAKDPRVIMIKIADRIHNMRTMRYMKPEKRRSIAQETLDIYVPLTHRFGLYKLKTELEDLSFKYVNPDEYQKIVDALIENKERREKYVQSVIGPLQIKMALEDFDCTIQGRTKNIYSIYNKMLSRDCQFDDIFDIFAIRIIVETIPECYLALGYVHNLWTPMQSRFKDYIATPKPNLYQSIHTTVIGPENKMVEVQIRTKDMDLTAEKGFAAHWAYKMETQHEGEELAWLDHMVKLQSEISDSKEYLDFLKVDLKPEGMTVFTPKGASIELPEGSTVLDFAFAIHTELGLHCIGARINDEVVSLDKVVTHGATIQILKSPHQEPSPEWLDIVKTVKAKQELRRWMKTSIIQQSMNLGKEIWPAKRKSASTSVRSTWTTSTSASARANCPCRTSTGSFRAEALSRRKCRSGSSPSSGTTRGPSPKKCPCKSGKRRASSSTSRTAAHRFPVTKSWASSGRRLVSRCTTGTVRTSRTSPSNSRLQSPGAPTYRSRS